MVVIGKHLILDANEWEGEGGTGKFRRAREEERFFRPFLSFLHALSVFTRPNSPYHFNV